MSTSGGRRDRPLYERANSYYFLAAALGGVGVFPYLIGTREVTPAADIWRNGWMRLAVVVWVLATAVLLAGVVIQAIHASRMFNQKRVEQRRVRDEEQRALEAAAARRAQQAVRVRPSGPADWIAMHWVELDHKGMMLCLDPPTLQDPVIRDTGVRFWVRVCRKDRRSWVSLRETDPAPAQGPTRVGFAFPSAFFPKLPWPLPEGDYTVEWHSIDFDDAHLPTSQFTVNEHGVPITPS